MSEPLEPEIIPPGAEPRRHGTPIENEALEQLATVLDDVFRIPGTNIRFGLDALAGLIPGLGDAVTGLVALLIVHAGWQRGLPRVTLARMVANIAIDSLLGAVPVVGDLFDVAWKANRRNMNLLRRAQQRPRPAHTASDWLFLLAAAVVILALAALPFVLLVWVIRGLAG